MAQAVLIVFRSCMAAISFSLTLQQFYVGRIGWAMVNIALGTLWMIAAIRAK